MAATIQVVKQSESEFRVTVEEGGSRSTHQVTLTGEYYQKLTRGAVAPEELIRRSFDFLLEHEPKESILARFDLPVIARYFPDYEREIVRRLR
ncbi:MAG TPA: hypothetical protein VLB32_05650 [Candidatus Acidoferrales bacterium]|nr:hypothetical protein [Candidatus Acidoferrales bacterium]